MQSEHEPEEECADVAQARRWPPKGYEDKEHGYPETELKLTTYIEDRMRAELERALIYKHDRETFRRLREGNWNQEE